MREQKMNLEGKENLTDLNENDRGADMKQVQPEAGEQSQRGPEMSRDDQVNTDAEPTIDEHTLLEQMIGTLLLQYLQLFDKAKIYEIKKVKSLQKHIINYISGYLKKLQ